ncbi:ABC transporter substrate-binding protein [Thauera linaloolentis]|uniref:ABC transporter substrate-binding protein n=1 Tax=Thauera linaloolentis (strain DSM 12138 / JCM 21573 / CCUG 41526 / CIP 105981 / IAM 15112 / NBRC 102519 / 47Lol) TaxID=1123367 RepID=N6YGN2_THAL4|nr:ABC transporter substrate binding protein [Thauera linaloolentis]ENO90670.1 hypothetical protein C666_00550 [Thauera linaloolentis 47Lol = DSM 12138]MCM8565578.1 hypothetical protein [Thauera linaloolentis]
MTGGRAIRGLLRGLVLGTLLAVSVLTNAAPRVLILGRSGDGVQAQAMAAMRDALADSIPEVEIEILPATRENLQRAGQAAAIVTLGREAASLAAGFPTSTPMVHAMLPAAALETLPTQRGGPAAAIVLDQPAPRLIALLGLALPATRNIALISSPASKTTVENLQRAAKSANFEVMHAHLANDDELFPALEHVLSRPGVLIATPDPVVFNRYTVQNILLATFRRRSPVLGFSDAYVRAGALLGLYSTPAQIGEDAADAVRGMLAGSPPSPVSGPKRFEVGVNDRVARALGLSLPSADALARELRRQEGAAP